MDDGKLEGDVYKSVSHWGLFDTSLTDGLVRVQCDRDGNHVGYVFEQMDEVLPLLVVEYEDRGQLIIMGNHVTGLIRERLWYPEHEGDMPPRDEFTSGMAHLEQAPANATRH